MSTDYSDIDSSYAGAIANVESWALNNGWTAEQEESALFDVQAAYDKNTGVGATADAIFDTDALELFGSFIFTSAPTYVSEAKAKGFWADLYALAKVKWATFPNGSKAIDAIASASGAAIVAAEKTTAGLPSTIVAGGVAGTVDDVKKAADATVSVLSDSTFWYGLAAVAVLGSTAYFVRAFR